MPLTNTSTHQRTGDRTGDDSSPLVGIVAVTPEHAEQADRIAQALHLPVLTDGELEAQTAGLFLVLNHSRVYVTDRRSRRANTLSVDFVRGPGAHRQRMGVGRRQLIGRAMGLKNGVSHVIDATAGFGADSFVLAGMGCKVLAIERNPAMAALLQDGLRRALQCSEDDFAATAGRIKLVLSDAGEVLANRRFDQPPEAVYLDPMYPPRINSALGKRALRICRSIVGDDGDADQLLGWARTVTLRRVVVKRLRKAKPLAPDVWLRYEGRSIRYDVYQPTANKPPT